MNVLKTLIFGLLKTFLFLCLVGVGKSGHSAHDTEEVVVDGIYAERVRRGLGRARNTVGRDAVEHQGRGVDAGEVTRSRRLVLLGLESK